MERFNKIYNTTIPKENFLIIGDTPKDVSCGHANGIPAVAVATGLYRYQILNKQKFSFILKNSHFSQKFSFFSKILIFYMFSAEQLGTIADFVLEDFGDIDASIKAFRETKLKATADLNYDIPLTTQKADP